MGASIGDAKLHKEEKRIIEREVSKKLSQK